jgi:FkbM family methyltransferase
MISKLFLHLNKQSIWKKSVTINGVQFHPNSADRFIALILHKFLPSANSFTKWIKINARRGDVVLDIGANQGLFAVAASNAVGPSGMVHAFEPDKDLAGCIWKTIRKNKIHNIKVHEIALGVKSEGLKLYKNPYNSGDNRLTTKTSDSGHSLLTVPVERLDNLSEIQKVDLVKIDVQGWELSVLQGMMDKMKNNLKAKILFEFWPHGMKIAGFDPLELIFYMIENGYTLTEESSGLKLSLDNSSAFVKDIRGKKYTDIEAVKLA